MVATPILDAIWPSRDPGVSSTRFLGDFFREFWEESSEIIDLRIPFVPPIYFSYFLPTFRCELPEVVKILEVADVIIQRLPEVADVTPRRLSDAAHLLPLVARTLLLDDFLEEAPRSCEYFQPSTISNYLKGFRISDRHGNWHHYSVLPSPPNVDDQNYQDYRSILPEFRSRNYFRKFLKF